MRWMLKAFAGKLLSFVPFHDKLYWYLQRNLTKSVVVADDMLKQKIDVGLEYLSKLLELKETEFILNASYCDVGAGWHLTIPLTFYCVGINKQHLIDIRRNLRASILQSVVTKMQDFRNYISEHNPLENKFRNLPIFKDGEVPDEYLKRLGITYQSPADARSTAFQNNSFDIITCTQVLQYPGHEDVEKILRESYRILKNDGLFVITAHLFDDYALFDKNISIYNYLKYSDFVWEKIINSSLLSHNRLRAGDYQEIFKKIGFNVKYMMLTPPTEKELEELRQLKLNRKFREMELQEVGIKEMFVILGK